MQTNACLDRVLAKKEKKFFNWGGGDQSLLKTCCNWSIPTSKADCVGTDRVLLKR